MLDLAISMARKRAIDTAFELAQQKRRATEALYAADCPAEALQAAAVALQAATALVAEASDEVSSEPPSAAEIEAALRAWGVSSARARAFVELRIAIAQSALPRRDAEIGEEDLRRLEAMVSACWLVEHAFQRTSRSRWQHAALRMAPVALLIVCALFVGAWLLSPKASASSVWGSQVFELGPENVLDDDPRTEWVPNDGELGWLELRFSRARDVRSISVRNGHNRQYNDRAAHDYIIELYRGEQLLAQSRQSFPKLDPAPSAVKIALRADGVDRVRLTLGSYFGVGAALADVDVR